MDEAIAPIRNVERQQIFSALFSDFIDSNGLGGRLRAEALINLACIDIYEHLGSSGANERTAILPTWVLDRVTEYIECNLESDVSLSVLAEIAGLSEFHFLRMFTASTGKTPYQFVLTRRFVRARDLLVNSDETIAQIAYQVGFSSQSHLTSMFKKMTGVTPGKFRRES
ncbi:MAG: AraC family transcriptional regulator [Pseudomonadota bacterium]